MARSYSKFAPKGEECAVRMSAMVDCSTERHAGLRHLASLSLLVTAAVASPAWYGAGRPAITTTSSIGNSTTTRADSR